MKMISNSTKKRWPRVVAVVLMTVLASFLLEETSYLTSRSSSIAPVNQIRDHGSQSSDPIDDYGDEAYSSVTDALKLPTKVDEADVEESLPAEISSDEDKNKYIECPESVIDPTFRGTRRIIVDADFHFYRDRYGITNPEFNHTQLEDVLRDVCKTWMKANIWVRFKRLPRQGELIRDEGADAMRWWVFGYKNLKANYTRYWKDVDLFLTNGASKMTREQAEREVIRRHTEYNGHSLMNWVLGLGQNKQGRTVKIDIYTVGFWPWYNGGAKRGRIFVRSGSCKRDVRASAGIAKDDRYHRTCNGWRSEHENETEMTTTEMSRILAHEFGHLFGLAHPENGACQYAPRVESLVLMAQQKSVALEGTECSITNPVAKFSRYIPRNEMTRARIVAGYISQEQRRRREARQN